MLAVGKSVDDWPSGRDLLGLDKYEVRYDKMFLYVEKHEKPGTGRGQVKRKLDHLGLTA